MLCSRRAPIRHVMDGAQIEHGVERIIASGNRRGVADGEVDAIGSEPGQPALGAIHHARVEVERQHTSRAEPLDHDLRPDAAP